jgi:hypothetical protein
MLSGKTANESASSCWLPLLQGQTQRLQQFILQL